MSSDITKKLNRAIYPVNTGVPDEEGVLILGSANGSTAMPIAVNTDNATLGATPNVLVAGGIYKTTFDTYNDNDAVPLHFDASGRLITAVELNDYTDDSTEFIAATSKILAIGGIATSDSVDSGDVGAFRMTVARNLGIDITTKDGAAWAVNNAINATIGDGTTVPVVETDGTKKALNVNITDGTNDMPTMDYRSRAGFVKVTDGTSDASVIIQDDLFGTGSAGFALFGKYEATPTTYGDGDAAPILLDANGRVVLSSDIEIGAVELKDATTDNRADINDANTARTTGTHVLAVQSIDAAGAVVSTTNIESYTSRLLSSANSYTSAATLATTSLGVGGQYNATPPTMTDTHSGSIQLDVNGNTKVNVVTGSITADTELPAAITLANDTANPTTPLIGACLMEFDGVTWDLGRGDSTDGLLVNLGSNNDVTLATLPDTATGDLATISGDTTSIDTKVPSQGTAVMTGSLPITIATDDTQFGTVGDIADVDGNIHGQLRYIGEAVDGLERSIPTPFAEYKSPSDFTATYTSNVTITLSSLPIVISDSSQIVYIKYIPTGGSGSAVLVNGYNGVTITESAGVLTVDGGGTPFAAGDVYEIGINAQQKAYDATTNSLLTSVENPLWERYTDAESLLGAAYELTNSFADVGSEIDVRGYNYLTFWATIDIGTSTNIQLRIIHKHTSAGSEEYREIYLGSPASNVTTINLNDYEINSDADQLFKITIPVTGSRYIQLQAKDDADGDGQIDALYITKDWGA